MREQLLPLTRQLAESLASEDGALTIARMQRLVLAAARSAAPERPDTRLRLGIWDPVARENGSIEFARAPDTARHWRYWADVERIPPKQGPRVVLVGESVARAYLFDPEVTLAGMLQASLGVEVVDLARTDLTAPHLPPIFDGLPSLDPDAIVLFVGNNWGSVRFEIEELELLSRAIRDGGFVRCREVFVQQLIRGRAHATLAAVEARLEGIPLCVVVPEFNLLDWRSEAAIVVPVLEDTSRWLALAEEGRSAEMIALDGGTSPVSQQMAAGEALAKGDMAAARQHLEAARDALCGLMIAHSPRCAGVVQEELRASARQHDFRLVDLPRLFGPLPDRRMFLDYCHLTGDGLRAVTIAIAEALKTILAVEPLPPPEPPAPVAARAHLLAAVHNAHYGQPPDVIAHHAALAHELDPAIGGFSGALVELVCHHVEPWLCNAWDSLRHEPQARRYLGSPEMLRAPRVADVELADAIAASGGLGRRVDELLVAEAASTPLDLLVPRHRATTFREAIGHGIGPPLGYVRATSAVSRFFVVRAHEEHLTGCVTLRGNGVVAVVVNGRLVVEVEADRRWGTHEIPLAFGRGRNIVELHWPMPTPDATAVFEQAARRLERGLYPEVLVAFGEIHSFTVR